MNGLDLSEIKSRIVEEFRQAVGEKLAAIILTGSLSADSYKMGWSDIDLLIVTNDLDFDTKHKIAGAVAGLENNSGIHHGVNVINKKELFAPMLPDILLDGKTLQSLIDLRKYPDRLIYSRKPLNIEDIYVPDNEILKKYSLSNIGMFLRRNRRTLTAELYEDKNIKELLKKEIRSSLIITKLAVQYFTATPQESYQEVLNRSKSLFPDFNFEVIENNFRIIGRWPELNDRNEILDVFRRVDNYIEKFSRYIFKKAKEVPTE